MLYEVIPQPVEIDVAPRNSTVEAISQKLYWVEKEHKTGSDLG